MIKHIVMWRIRGDTPAEKQAACQRIKQAFDGLRGRIPGLLSIEVGEDQSAVDYACDLVLVSEYIDTHALRLYATHPEHVRVREDLGELRIARFQVDYVVADRGTR